MYIYIYIYIYIYNIYIYMLLNSCDGEAIVMFQAHAYYTVTCVSCSSNPCPSGMHNFAAKNVVGSNERSAGAQYSGPPVDQGVQVRY